MLTKIKSTLIVLLLAASVCATSALSWALISVSVAAEQSRVTLVHVDQAVLDADETLAAMRLQEAQVAHRVLDQGGILDGIEDEQRQVRDVTRSARVSVDEVGITAIQERHYWQDELPLLTGQVSQTLTAARTTIAAGAPVLAQAQRTLAAAVPLEQQAAQVAHDLDTRIASPQVTSMLNSGAQLGVQSAAVATNLNHTTYDAASELHSLFHPAWPGKVAHKLRHPFTKQKQVTQ